MKKPSLALLAVLSTGALLAASPAAAFTDAQHRAMMRDFPAYAQADKELNTAWRELRTALKSAGMQGQLDGSETKYALSLLASQREWLAQRDSEAERLRAGGSMVDGHIAAMRERTAFLRERARAVRAFAALPAPAANAPFMRLLRASGGRNGELSFNECEGDSGSPQQRCASTTPSSLNFFGDGTAIWAAGGGGNLYVGHRWKLLPDGRVRVTTWESAADYTLHDGRYLEGDGDWYVLGEGSGTGEFGQPD